MRKAWILVLLGAAVFGSVFYYLKQHPSAVFPSEKNPVSHTGTPEVQNSLQTQPTASPEIAASETVQSFWKAADTSADPQIVKIENKKLTGSIRFLSEAELFNAPPFFDNPEKINTIITISIPNGIQFPEGKVNIQDQMVMIDGKEIFESSAVGGKIEVLGNQIIVRTEQTGTAANSSEDGKKLIFDNELFLDSLIISDEDLSMENVGSITANSVFSDGTGNSPDNVRSVSASVSIQNPDPIKSVKDSYQKLLSLLNENNQTKTVPTEEKTENSSTGIEGLKVISTSETSGTGISMAVSATDSTGIEGLTKISVSQTPQATITADTKTPESNSKNEQNIFSEKIMGENNKNATPPSTGIEGLRVVFTAIPSDSPAANCPAEEAPQNPAETASAAVKSTANSSVSVNGIQGLTVISTKEPLQSENILNPTKENLQVSAEAGNPMNKVQESNLSDSLPAGTEGWTASSTAMISEKTPLNSQVLATPSASVNAGKTVQKILRTETPQPVKIGPLTIASTDESSFCCIDHCPAGITPRPSSECTAESVEEKTSSAGIKITTVPVLSVTVLPRIGSDSKANGQIPLVPVVGITESVDSAGNPAIGLDQAAVAGSVAIENIPVNGSGTTEESATDLLPSEKTDADTAFSSLEKEGSQEESPSVISDRTSAAASASGSEAGTETGGGEMSLESVPASDKTESDTSAAAISLSSSEEVSAANSDGSSGSYSAQGTGAGSSYTAPAASSGYVSSAPSVSEVNESVSFPNIMPETGFPTGKMTSLEPAAIVYTDLGLHLEIPVLDVQTEIVSVPETDEAWNVKWLASKAGLLSGSALPGKGRTYIAAHNHLNNAEVGPFLFIKDLKSNDRIFIEDHSGGINQYKVVKNQLFSPDDFAGVQKTASDFTDTLTLITCEDEKADGGYLWRRVVFAERVG